MHIDFNKQLTQEEANVFLKSKAWKDLTDVEVTRIGLMQDLFCIPFEYLQQCAQRVFKRDLSQSEMRLTRDLLLKELNARENLQHVINDTHYK